MIYQFTYVVDNITQSSANLPILVYNKHVRRGKSGNHQGGGTMTTQSSYIMEAIARGYRFEEKVSTQKVFSSW